MKKLGLILGCCLWILSAQSEVVMVEKTSFYLDNGLKVVLLDDPSASLVSVRTYVRAGSVDEEPLFGSGVSHYLEHVVAGGTTEERAEDEYKSLISHLGGAYNAYTTTDHTSYFINTTPDRITDAINILNEWMFHCKFDEREVSREREVIIREIEKTQASVFRNFYQLSQENFFKHHPLRLPVIGYLENFKALTRSDLINYYRSRYVPSNMILVVGGDLDVAAVKKTVEKTFGQQVRKASPKTSVNHEPPPFGSRLVEKEGLTNITYLSIRFATVDLVHPDLYGLDLLEFILGNGEDSIFYHKLVEDEKLAYSVNTGSYTPSLTNGYFDITLEIDYENKDKVTQRIYEIIEDIKSGKVDTHRVKRAKKQKLAEDIFSISNIEDKVSRLGQSNLYGYSDDFFETYVKNFRSVTKNDVIEMAKKYLDENRAIVTILRPKGTKLATGNAGQTAKADDEGTPISQRLSNGIRVLFYKDSSLPRVHTKAFMLGGIRAESPDKNGVGQVLADLLGRQSRRYSKKEMKRLIEDNGASMGGSLGKNTLFFNLDCLSEDFPRLFDVYADAFINPKFADKDLKESKRKILKSISTIKDDWFSYGIYMTKKHFYKDHPYSQSLLGEKESVSGLTVADVQAHYDKLLRTNEMVITVFGDFDDLEVLQSLEKTFGKIKTPKTNTLSQALNREMHGARQSIDSPIEQDVAGLFIVFDGISYKDGTEFEKIDLLDSVLSGMSYPSGRFHNQLREKGLVYMVHAVNFVGIESGHFLIYALTTPHQVEEVKKVIFNEIRDVKTKLVSKKEFDEAVSQVKFYYKDRVSTLGSLALVMATDELYGRGYEFYTTQEEILNGLTRQDVKKTAAKYLKNPQIYTYQNSKKK